MDITLVLGSDKMGQAAKKHLGLEYIDIPSATNALFETLAQQQTKTQIVVNYSGSAAVRVTISGENSQEVLDCGRRFEALLKHENA